MRWLRGLALALALAAACTSGPAEEEPSGNRAVPTAATGPSADPADAATVPTGTTSGSTGAGPTGPTGPASPAEPARTRFAGRISALPPALAAEMRGTTWKRGCPVPLDQLRLLRFNYHGFDGTIHRGPMVVNEAVAQDVLWVFEQLFDASFPIKHVALTKEFDPDRYEDSRRITSYSSVTAAFDCRPVILPTGPIDTYSQHSYGWAIDLNPLQNPFVTADGFVRNRVAEQYLDRSQDLPGMVHDGDLVVRAFAAIGWDWGGHWHDSKDYMHFSLSGR